MFGTGFDPGDGGHDGTSGGADGQVAARFGFDGGALILPDIDQLPAHLAALVARHGATAIVRALLQSVSADRLMSITEQLCAQQFGVEPVLADELGEHAWEATPCPASPTSVTLLTRVRKRTRDGQSLFEFRRCWHCEPYAGKSEPTCVAVRTLHDLAADLQEQSDKVDHAEEFGDVQGAARDAARYFMYRRYVHAAFGFLGKGKRIRIPPCVVELIRDRFRAPVRQCPSRLPGASRCQCPVGGPLFNCPDYVGHRDAPDADAGDE